jgi:hypothetical protein
MPGNRKRTRTPEPEPDDTLQGAFEAARYLAGTASLIHRVFTDFATGPPPSPKLRKTMADAVEELHSRWNSCHAKITAVESELLEAATGMPSHTIQFESIIAPTAHHAAMSLANRVLVAVHHAVDPNFGIRSGGRMPPNAVVKNFKRIATNFPLEGLPAAEMLVSMMQLEQAEAGRRRRERAPGLGHTPPDRLTFDVHTQTITLDGKAFPNVAPQAFRVYKVIADACPAPVTAASIRGKVSGCSGRNKVRLLLEELPLRLRSTIQSCPSGYYLKLPPV